VQVDRANKAEKCSNVRMVPKGYEVGQPRVVDPGEHIVQEVTI
jgi:hypothetical protein